MSWEFIVAIVGLVLPYVIWIERRLQMMSDRISGKVSNEQVKELIDLKQEKLTERLDNLKEDMKEIKEKLDQLVTKR